MNETIHIEGRLYLSLETIASIYQVQLVWLEEACAEGLFGSGTVHQGTRCIEAEHLDLVAVAVRLHLVLELDLKSIARELQATRARWE